MIFDKYGFSGSRVFLGSVSGMILLVTPFYGVSARVATSGSDYDTCVKNVDNASLTVAPRITGKVEYEAVQGHPASQVLVTSVPKVAGVDLKTNLAVSDIGQFYGSHNPLTGAKTIDQRGSYYEFSLEVTTSSDKRTSKETSNGVKAGITSQDFVIDSKLPLTSGDFGTSATQAQIQKFCDAQKLVPGQVKSFGSTSDRKYWLYWLSGKLSATISGGCVKSDGSGQHDKGISSSAVFDLPVNVICSRDALNVGRVPSSGVTSAAGGFVNNSPGGHQVLQGAVNTNASSAVSHSVLKGAAAPYTPSH